MKSGIAKKILSETPNEVKQKAREHADNLIKKKTMDKADNLPMSSEEYFKKLKTPLELFSFSESYANYLLSHHINVLAERIAEDYSISYMDADGITTVKLKKEKVLKIAKDYINELNLNK